MQQRSSTTTSIRQGSESKTGGGGASLSLSVARDMKLIATVRRFVGELCVRVIGDSNVTARVVIATHELLDNAVRHGLSWSESPDDEHARIQVVVRRVDESAHVTIDTTNRIDAAATATATATATQNDLEKIFAAMREHDKDRLQFYRALLQRVAQQRGPGLGLGLGRVHAESEMNLTSRFNPEGGLFHVRAEGLFPVSPGGGGR